MKNVPLTLAVAVGGKGVSRVFQDAGDGYAYRDGVSRTIVVRQDEGGVRLDIPASHGYQRVGAIEFIGLQAAPAGVRIDGKAVPEAKFDAAARRLRIPFPDENVGQVVLGP
jgi:alpha-glucosidase